NWGEDSDEESHLPEDVSTAKAPLKRCPDTDKAFLEEQTQKLASLSPQFKSIMDFRQKLPAWEKRDSITQAIESHQVVVISGETGCGKTTQVPQFILDEAIRQGNGSVTNIICTQPRRISAVSVAERVLQERCGSSSQGRPVGYQIRLESKLPRERGSITFCTTGVPLQWMKSNSELKGISHVILDEIHERDILSDLFLTLLKDIVAKRPDLKVILMSATLNAHQFSKYFGGCPVIEIPGRIFPVEEYYLEDVLEMTGYRITDDFNRRPAHGGHRRARKENMEYEKHLDFFSPFLRNIEDRFSDATMDSLSNFKSEQFNPELIASLVHHIHHREPEGAILVFLSGWNEISDVHRLLTDSKEYSRAQGLVVHPLHSLMPTVNQREIFERPPRNLRKVILATNIAETSITIDDVVYVIDAGKIKLLDFEKESNVDTLKPRWISIANARQRKGRAGRVQAGVCYRLYTSYRASTFESYVKPEILRTRLDEVILNIKVLGLGPAAPFLDKMMEPPDSESVQHALQFLRNIRALQGDEQLTHLGLHLSELPMNPQTGKMVLLGAIFSCLDPILSIAASLNFKDPFVIPLGKEDMAHKRKNYLSKGSASDHLTLANVMTEGRFCWDNFLSESKVKMLNDLKKQFAEYLYDKKFLSTKISRILRRMSIVAAGLYPNVAKFSGRKGPNSLRISIHPKSVLANGPGSVCPWIVYQLMLKGESSTSILDGSTVSPLSLVLWAKDKEPSNNGELRLDDIVQFSATREDLDNILAKNESASTCRLEKESLSRRASSKLIFTIITYSTGLLDERNSIVSCSLGCFFSKLINSLSIFLADLTTKVKEEDSNTAPHNSSRR
ncbi:Putative ATPdependent RNA helicase DHX36like, partial [Caligus rogercresseyi]